MSKADSNAPGPLTFYPAYCYTASPTYFAWVKLTADDIHHRLRSRDAPQRQHSSTGNPLSFYLNHPIQFVQIAGVVVAVEEYHPHIFLFTLDDSSGSTIDVVWRKPKQDPNDGDNTGQAQRQAQPLASHNVPKTVSAKAPIIPSANTPPLAEGDALPALLTTLQIGTLVLAKGTITTFRHSPQLSLLRLSVLTPQQELHFIQLRSSFLLSTLSKVWRVSNEVQRRLLAKATGEKEAESERAARARRRQEVKEKREKRDEEEIVRRWEEEERERARKGEEARLAGLELSRLRDERK